MAKRALEKTVIDLVDYSGDNRNNAGLIFNENLEDDPTKYSVGDILRFEQSSQGNDEYYEVIRDAHGKLTIKRDYDYQPENDEPWNNNEEPENDTDVDTDNEQDAGKRSRKGGRKTRKGRKGRKGRKSKKGRKTRKGRKSTFKKSRAK